MQNQQVVLPHASHEHTQTVAEAEPNQHVFRAHETPSLYLQVPNGQNGWVISRNSYHAGTASAVLLMLPLRDHTVL